MSMPEREQQVAHAKERARQRYGPDFTPEDYDDACDAIMYGAARLVLTQEPGREVWEVTRPGKRPRKVVAVGWLP